MKRFHLLFLVLFLVNSAFLRAQFERNICLNATADFNIALNGFGTDAEGIGMVIETSFFAKHRLQLTTELNGNIFFGNKVFYPDPQTGTNAQSRLYTLTLGPQFFITKNVAIAGTLGTGWFKIRDFEYQNDLTYRLSVNSFIGSHRKFVAKASWTKINILQYLSLGAGYRF